MVGEAALLGGRYRLGERIAAGGMGTVYAATDERLGRQVAVKILRDELADDERFAERFRREARAAAALTHPNVAAVFDYGGDGGRPFIVMELARGRDLAMLLREEGPLAPERAAAIGAQVCDALAHAHAAGLVHRDVKPANVIVDDADTVKVTDFGIARAAGESTLTVTGSVLGSAHYIAPEQASGGQVTAATDVYAAGILLYEMLTNALPFTGESALAIAMRHVSDEVPAPSALNPRVPEWLDGIVARATAKDPAARWADARNMAEALRRGGAGAGRGAAAVGSAGTGTTQVIGPEGAGQTSVWPIPGTRYDPRRLGARVIAGAVLVALLAGGLFAWRLATRDEEETPAASTRDGRAGDGRATEPAAEQSEAYELVNLTGWDVKEAEKVLEDQGFGVTIEELPHEQPKDTVLATEPPPGTALSPGDTVTLIVSTGKVEEEDDPEDEEPEEGPPGHSGDPPGHSKDKDKEED